jgi:hypothetical protein
MTHKPEVIEGYLAIDHIEAQIRNLAVEMTDAVHQYTMEFAPSPKEHEFLYDLVSTNIKEAIVMGINGIAVDPYRGV